MDSALQPCSCDCLDFSGFTAALLELFSYRLRKTPLNTSCFSHEIIWIPYEKVLYINCPHDTDSPRLTLVHRLPGKLSVNFDVMAGMPEVWLRCFSSELWINLLQLPTGGFFVYEKECV